MPPLAEGGLRVIGLEHPVAQLVQHRHYRRLHVRVARAPRVEEQAAVVRLHGGLLVGAEPVRKTHRDHRGAQPMPEGEAHAQVGGQAQGTSHVGNPNVRLGHKSIVALKHPVLRRSGQGNRRSCHPSGEAVQADW